MLVFEVIINLCSVASNIAIIITMIYGIMKFRQDKLNVIADLNRQTKSETITFANEILEKTDNLFFEIRSKFGNDTINVSDLQNEKNPELDKVISKYLSLMERLSVGLNTKVYDFDVYARICCSKTIRAWTQLENIIFEKRKNSGNDLLYIEFETVVNDLRRWKAGAPETRGNYERLK